MNVSGGDPCLNSEVNLERKLLLREIHTLHGLQADLTRCRLERGSKGSESI
jgi:hypothetical protein